MRPRPTYTAEQIAEARGLWDGFSAEWEPCRALAMRGPGIIYPPDGDAYDSWADAHPSQRAILVRAIRETPDLLRWAIRGAQEPSWRVVIERLLAGRDEMREQLELEPEPERYDLSPRDTTRRLAEILVVLQDSAA